MEKLRKSSVHYVMWQFAPGGMELSVVPYLNRFRDEFAFFAYGIRAQEDGIFHPDQVTLTKGDAGKWKSYLQCWRYFRRHRSQIFHLLNTGPYIVLLALGAGVRQPLYHIHGTVHGKSWLGRLMIRFAWWAAGRFPIRFIANSLHSARAFRRGALDVAPQIIYNGFDCGPYWHLRRKRQSLRRMAYAGRLAPGKNVDLVIRVFEYCAALIPEIELHIAGDGPLRETLGQQAAKSPCADRITFHGFVEDMPSFYGEMDLLLFLSANESFGNVLAEALLTGLPVLTSNVPVFREIYGDEPMYQLGDPAQVGLLKKRLLQAVYNFPALAEKALATSQDVRRKFDLSNHLMQIRHAYDKA